MYRILTIFMVISITACVTSDIQMPQENTLLDSERAAGWKLLFDGKSLDGWVPSTAGTWAIEDNSIAHSKEGAMGPLDMIWTTRKFGDFILKCDFKITEG